MTDLKQTTCSTQTQSCEGCAYATGPGTTGINASGMLTLTLVLGLVSYYFFKLYKKRYILFIGSMAIVFIVASSFVHLSSENPEPSTILAATDSVDEFHVAGDEFVAVEEPSGPDSAEAFTGVGNDEFSPVENSDEFVGADEFSSGNLDEFSEDNGEFSEASAGLTTNQPKKDRKQLRDLMILLSLLILIGLFMNNSTFRKLRPLFLLGMVVWLGFIRGGCPCMISSFHNTVLAGLGNDVSWVSLLWFLGLIPVTYFGGKIWCGWLCHLGGLQEFLFSATRLEFLTKPKHQKVIKTIQVAVFVVLLVQIIITRTNIFIHYDPFKVAFNLFSANATGYVLLFILLTSSVLVYRPFCRAFCPVGMVLGLVAQLPKARTIIQSDDCVDCVRCSKECKSNAITYENKTSQINAGNCIACGDCLDSCRKTALRFSVKKKTVKVG